MKPRPASIVQRPFADLGQRLAAKQVRLPAVRLPDPPARPPTPAEEKALFDAAMADVVPLNDRGLIVACRPQPKRPAGRVPSDDVEALRQLRCLVETGSGFVLSQTAEYIEGAYGHAPPELLRRLHNGHFAIQGHVDLHGMDVQTACSAFDDFMRRAVSLHLRAVLVVHGRGRSSPGPPVLKRCLLEWLTRGNWRRWIIAFTSARACDGGTGATVVLLRSSSRSAKRVRSLR
ncbi:Smr protein/MutS2 [Desulfosarcina cetonica]|nr:Smr protein/MutS2 [Desulfosarcina cetonica]